MRKGIFTLFFLISITAFANNITVTNTGLSGQNTTSDFTLVNFDVAWENSWRTSTNESNYDGAWIFVKFRKNGTTDWRHCTINSTGNTAGAGSAFSVPADGKGAFIFRSGDGLGNVNFTTNKLQWNYGADGLLDNDSVEIRVFALEMVYIPQGAFYLGSGGTEANPFENGTTNTPYLVTGNGVITVGTAAGNLNMNGNGAAGTILAPYPKGFNAFWIMKYECSQQQYVDFLNHLDNARAVINNTQNFFTGAHPNLVAPQPERAVGSLGFLRVAAHADWSGLRPMTELEYEKACRGFNTPSVPNEYAWGNTTLVPLTTTANTGTATEAVATPVSANAVIASAYSNGSAARTGLFARPSGSDRTLSGGTYYGVMNMSDNLYEIVFSAASTPGRNVDAAIHGDGFLAANGNSSITLWNDYNAYGHRGSSWAGPVGEARVSNRNNANFFVSYPSDFISTQHGIRLVRTAQ
ncbi:MAG TPA: SUMF1/EgtB/PvdO family nonheme iron enzyme [Flavisolibacter sp.]|nr:SUMF1/EgtB/PvdO family nonheme iron enzyme [Flavisolibacter sp.]